MKLKIISPYSTEEYAIVWIELNTPVGNMIIQKEHAPMLIEINPNSEILFLMSNGKQKTIIITQAFAHVHRKEVKILATQ